MNEKVAVVGIVGLPANYGGFETLVDNLVSEKGELFRIYCSSAAYGKKIRKYKNCDLFYIPLKANGIQSIAYDFISIFHAIASGYKKILILGVSGALAIKMVRIFFPKILTITNIDGLEWRREKWGKFTRAFLKILESIAIKNSTHIICDNPAILDYVKNNYGINGHLIAYGGDNAIPKNTINKNDLNKKSEYYLSICRIEPENNIHIILKPFSENNKKIIFIGNWQASTYGLNLKNQFSAYKNIELLDPIYDQEKLFIFRKNCIGYIHGHSAGGTNPSLVEMMHFGKPIILFDCQYNRATMLNEGLYFSNSADLKEILNNPINSIVMGAKIKKIAQENYTWKSIRNKYFEILDIK